MMNTKSPSPEERKRLLQSFQDLPPKDKEMFYKEFLFSVQKHENEKGRTSGKRQAKRLL